MKVLLSLASFAVGLSLLVCSPTISAQTIPKPIEAAEILDEYGSIGGCDHSARLDNLAIMLQENPNLEGYVVYYGPESASERTLGYIKDYLLNSRGLDEERWKTIYAGPNSDLTKPRIQLWLAPQGAPPPELVKYESKVETFNGLFDERERWDGIYLGEGEGTGPPVPDVSVPNFIDMLKSRKDAVAYIVAFSGTEAAPGAWHRVTQQESEDLQSMGLASDRIRTIYGGSDQKSKETRVQLWILPASAPPPLADAGPELPPNKTLRLGTFGDYQLADERGERWAFKVLLDGLRTSEELRACIIVRLERQVAEEEAEETQEKAPVTTDVPSTPDEISEPQPVDLPTLIDKWKSELADKYKIRDDRIVVLFTTAHENEGDTLETWIVPPGSLLPDPDAEPAEDTSEETGPVEAVPEKVGVAPEDVKSDKVRPDKTQPDKAQPEKTNPLELLLPDA